MSFRATFMLCAVAAGLFAFIYFFDQKPVAKTVESQVLLPGLDPRNVTAIEVTRTNFAVRAVRTNDGWQLTNPSYPAQSTGIESLIDALARAPQSGRVAAHEVLNENGGLRAFGLEPPRAAIGVNSAAGRIHLNLGNYAPMTNQIYVQVVGSADVLVTDAQLLQHLPISTAQWRDPRLLDPALLRFDRVQIASGAKSFELQKNPTNSQWQISKPLAARADSNRVEELLVRLRTARVSQFVLDTPAVDLEPFGLQTPSAICALVTGTNLLETLEFGKSPTNDASVVFVRNTARSNIVLVSRELLDFLQQPYKNFHDPRLLGFATANVTAIQVRAGDAFDIEKRNNGWVLMPANITADAQAVGAFLTNAANMQIVDFAKDVPAEADLKTYGLAPPKAQYSFQTLTTNNAGLATNVSIVQAWFGNAQLDVTFAQRSDEVPAYKVLTADVLELPTQAFQLRERRLWTFAPSAVTNVSFVVNDTTNSVARAPAAPWSRDEVFNAAMEEIFFRLVQVRAVRWIAKGESKSALFGLSPATSSVRIAGADTSAPISAAITFGRRSPSGNVYASYTPAGEKEQLIFEFPGVIYQDLLRLLGPAPK